MLRTFFRIAFRNLIKDKFYSILNVLGLSIGICVALIIALFILHELSYDQFHSKKERIHRIAMHLEIGGNVSDMNSTFPGMAEAIEAEIPEVEQAVRLYLLNGRIFKSDEKVFTEDNVLYADADLFKVFDFRALAGSKNEALTKPNQVMLTPALARKYFDTENSYEVVGQTISINQESYQVTGIIEEAPQNSHVKFTAVASMLSLRQGRTVDWDNLNLSTYLLLHEGSSIETVKQKLPLVFARHMKDYQNMGKNGIVMDPIYQRLTELHLYSNLQGEFEPSGSITTLFVFGSVAIVVLILASVNFINLVTARSANRAKEVGVRKVLGSASRQLMMQFICECMLLVFIATLLALGMVELIRVPFALLSGTALAFDRLVEPLNILFLVGFVIILGLLAGLYPAFFLSSYQPSQVLKGRIRSGFRSGRLRNSLVTLQFVISIVLITCTLIVQRQLSFMRSTRLGFDKENVVVIDNSNRLPNQQAYINRIVSVPGVVNVGASTFRPVDDYDGMVVVVGNDETNRKLTNFSRVDEEYLKVLKYEFVAGRNFSRDFPSDSAAIIVNERAAEFLFGKIDAIGETINNGIDYKVVGVVKDFNFESLKNEVRPLVFYLHPNQRFLHVRIEPGNYKPVIEQLEKNWKAETAEIPFSYAFLDDTYDQLYKQETRLGFLFNVFTAIALVIACLGLVGLAAYTAEQRKKEMSIRKVLGATPRVIVSLLSREFVRVIIISFCMAAPIAYYLMNQWLKTFAYKVAFPLYMVVLAGVVVLAIAMASVLYQSVRAATANPVDALKEE